MSSPTLSMQLRPQVTIEIHHVTLSSRFSAAPTSPPEFSVASFPGCHRFHVNLNVHNVPQRLAPNTPSNRPGTNDDAGNGVDD